ncbi:DUF3618 domain-containing protein [Cellulomonas sp. zg-ZUI222]|uniref:DUF3618 domain-containing protein n=1 Tax=Cellulomonas wangleii TaxID=2816956 RepID=A0ABX8D2M7_9CELL|nr:MULTISPECIES: DUF3618 domain-containing protein [Cellulomonas]MBO0899367.1 DUF3618 domain-containing protein [Cellulomonas sp. zg-ZUI22]MBO0920219.1 DUF3618 domain-containing protein [Cellulomonas wangleii]MBO0923355.1 DUF3618 domain-containing protein [Cellulomonas wangleii]QVI61710.1 DUF3618 domain-containing protein [Cellulomonas wangleii]
MSAEEITPTPATDIGTLTAEAALARAQLAETVDALVDRVDPRRQAERAKDRGRRLVFDATDPAALPEDRARARKVLVVAGVVVALVVVGIVRRATRD